MGVGVETINQALSFIERHLDDKLQVNDVADAIHYSRYHLHRSFSTTVGITIHDYIRRRQLTEAARLLVYTDLPIVNVAHIAGYNTQQAFSTVFKSMYKMSPKQFRFFSSYYPLQLRYNFTGHVADWRFIPGKVEYATVDDMASWMELVKLVIDGYPYWEPEGYERLLEEYISLGQAFILKNAGTAIGIMLVNKQAGSIDFLGVHPFYKRLGIDRMLIETAKNHIFENRPITTTTYREGDKADTGFRKALLDIGFREDELLVEFGYPTQRLIL